MDLRIAVVGPCASGKTTLVEGLRQKGLAGTYSVPQEHSVAPRLWMKRTPHILVFLDVSYASVRLRRHVSWGPDRLEAQRGRLQHSREHAHIYIDTDVVDGREVVDLVLSKIEEGEGSDGSNPGYCEE